MASSVITGVSDSSLVIATKARSERRIGVKEKKEVAKPASIFIYATQLITIPYRADYITN
jgi:hypothetical protein